MGTLTSCSFTSTLNLGFRSKPNRFEFTERFRHYNKRNYGNNRYVLCSRDVLLNKTRRVAGLDIGNKGFIGGFECCASGRDSDSDGAEEIDTSKDSNLATFSPEDTTAAGGGGGGGGGEVDSDKPVAPPASISSGVSNEFI